MDFLKIDGGFVRDITRDPMDRALVAAINRIDHTVGQKTVVKFVEDEATRRELVGLGVDYAQGYACTVPNLCKPVARCMPTQLGSCGRCATRFADRIDALMAWRCPRQAQPLHSTAVAWPSP